MLDVFFELHKKAALCFSGGVDSGYLFYVAMQLGCDVRAYYVKSEFQPDFELRDATRLAYELGGELKVLTLSVLDNQYVATNHETRCYHCKKMILAKIKDCAESEGYSVLIDGNNASDDVGDRPGMRAADEYGVLSPLRIAGLTKNDIRSLAKEAGLFIWNKPSYSCLATRFVTGAELNKNMLSKVERGENLLFELGFNDFRFRVRDGYALIQVVSGQMEKAKYLLNSIEKELKHDFEVIKLDTEPRIGESSLQLI